MNTIRLTRTDAALIYGLGAAALALSYTALADLAGLGQWQAAVWPLLVDGLIVAATRVVVTLDDGAARRYAWTLLWSAVVVSIAGNAAHLLLPSGPVHPGVATVVAVVPPVAALALTHLAIVRARALASAASTSDKNRPENILTEPIAVDDAHASAQLTVVAAPAPSEATRPDDVTGDAVDALRHRARQLRADGWSNYAIADEIGKSEATVRR
ncbi:excisionase [Rhodococcus pyridinivorans]|uniref:helix-turn-helix domain-containing protein n=1 Tax=Rhodococcus pyridinivorans TaxID=103816 RepID=UPI00030829E6|nr:helix-turn-helix domain-containing protein [Rhodococcus pyridinivorans]AWZ25616.1 excisionase [Rhodococcus pyridinivorans]